MQDFLSRTFLPLLVAAGLAYYGIRALICGDISALQGRDTRKQIRNKEDFAKEAGKLLLFLAAVSAGMAVLVYFVSPVAAFVELAAGVVLFAVLWKRIIDKNT